MDQPQTDARAADLIRQARNILQFSSMPPMDAFEVVQLAHAGHELRSKFYVRWQSDLRAVSRWRAAHPELEQAMPSHEDLIVWLMEELCSHRGRAENQYARGLEDAAGVCLATAERLAPEGKRSSQVDRRVSQVLFDAAQRILEKKPQHADTSP